MVYGAEDEDASCPWHIQRHFKAIEHAVKGARVQNYHNLGRRVESIALTYGLHAVIDVSLQGEVLMLCCDIEGEAFALDLQYWLEKSRALSFEVRVFPDYESFFLNNPLEA